jgi:hypothetical protein
MIFTCKLSWIFFKLLQKSPMYLLHHKDTVWKLDTMELDVYSKFITNFKCRGRGPTWQNLRTSSHGNLRRSYGSWAELVFIDPTGACMNVQLDAHWSLKCSKLWSEVVIFLLFTGRLRFNGSAISCKNWEQDQWNQKMQWCFSHMEFVHQQTRTQLMFWRYQLFNMSQNCLQYL